MDIHPKALLQPLLETRGNEAAVLFSGQTAALVHMASRCMPGIRVVWIDTGALHPETAAFVHDVAARYDITFEILNVNQEHVAHMTPDYVRAAVRNRMICCAQRKVAPLEARLRQGDVAFLIDGVHRDVDTPTRTAPPTVRNDEQLSAATGIHLERVSPFASWTHAEVRAYIEAEHIPCNPLLQRGYVSIGCAPCTRRTTPGEPKRAGRWWWEARDSAHTECGLCFAATEPT